MRRKLAALLALLMLVTTCFSSYAAQAQEWSLTTAGNWQALKDNALIKSSWIHDLNDDKYYAVDEAGNLIVEKLIVDGHGQYYTMNDQHDGTYGSLITKDGTYYGVELTFSQKHDGTFGSITNEAGIKALAKAYGTKKCTYLTNDKSAAIGSQKGNYIIDTTTNESKGSTETFTVTFDENGVAAKDMPETLTVAKGSKVTKPAEEPWDSNYELTFEGWYKNANCTFKWDFENDVVTKDITLYAKWSKPKYTVTFDTNGYGEAIPSQQVELGGKVVKPASPSDATHLKYFDGWYDGDELFDFENGTVEGDTTLTAKWSNAYLTFSSETAFTLSATNRIGLPDGLQYSTDAENWTAFDGTAFGAVQGNDGKYYAYLRGTGLIRTGHKSGGSDPTKLSLTPESAEIDCFGNIMTLLDYKDPNEAVMGEYAFSSLFKNCTALKTAPTLPATALAPFCYLDMFSGCTGLTEAPELPATTLARSCYSGIFSGCTNITTAPKLPATTLAPYCYNNMFLGTGLTNAPALPWTNLEEGCYYGMFKDCTSLTSAPELPATTLAKDCYHHMFSGCTILTTAPELPATNLAAYCYFGMFNSCTNLTSAPELKATVLAEFCYNRMFSGCTILNVVPCTTAGETGFVTIPSGELPNNAVTMMFQGTPKASDIGTDGTPIAGKSYKIKTP